MNARRYVSPSLRTRLLNALAHDQPFTQLWAGEYAPDQREIVIEQSRRSAGDQPSDTVPVTRHVFDVVRYSGLIFAQHRTAVQVPPPPTSPEAERWLIALLHAVDGDARIVDVVESTAVELHGYATVNGMRSKPTHAVIDSEGESIGCGMTAWHAVADAIERALADERKRYHSLHDAVRTLAAARADLDELT